MLSNFGGLRGWRVLWTSNLYFFIKEDWIWISATTRHHTNNILLTRNLPFESDVREWSHPLMMSLHCFWVKSDNITGGPFEYDVTFFCLFLFDFVHSYARCGCCSIVCLRFQVAQIKQVDCKMSTKMWTIINKKHFVIFLDNCTHKNIKPRKSR